MTRRLIASVLATLIVPAAAPAATTVDVPRKLRDQIAQARDSGVRVLVPDTIRAPGRVFADDARVRRGRYTLSLGRVRGCNRATVCFFAAFEARRGARPSGERRVRLARGRAGWFTPSRCGASCSAAQVAWRQGGVRYTIQIKGAGRRGLVRAANQAIRAGAR